MREFLFAVFCWLATVSAAAQDAARTIVFVSDVHFGLGRDAQGKWDPKEDFRSPEVVQPALDALRQTYGDRIDLVVLGDLLELWQPPASIQCDDSGTPDLGCTVPKMAGIARHVAAAHAAELASLGEFARQGDNCVWIVPGNHDSALLVDAVWKEVRPKFGGPGTRVSRVDSGVWVSGDGIVIGEHGHQIAPDANLYPKWPEVTRKPRASQEARMIRPWGEWFVQHLFNRDEEHYPLVDNVTGSSGAKFRMKDRGFAGTVADAVRFVRFVLFQSSRAQQLKLLAPPPPPADPARPRWNIAYARTRKRELVRLGLGPDDPLRAMLDDPEAGAALDALIERDMTDAEIEALCASLPATGPNSHPCKPPNLGQLARATIIPKSYLLRRHLKDRKDRYRSAAVFVYGHTHKLELPWRIAIDGGYSMLVANTGAFHRITDAETFIQAAKDADLSPEEALKELPFDVLPPCHTAVIVTRKDGLPRVDVQQWTDEGWTDACAGACARVSGCPE